MDGPRPQNAELSFARSLLLFRCAWVCVGAFTVATRPARFRRPGLAGAAVAVAACDLAWSARRLSRRKSWDEPVVAIVDNMVGVAVVTAIAFSVDDSEQFGPLTDWAFNLVLWSSAATASGIGNVGAGLAAVMTSSAVYVAVVGHCARASQRGLVLANAAQFLLFFAADSGLIRSLRRSERQIDAAKRVAVDAAEQTATEHERLRFTVEVHGRVLGALEEIASLWGHDPSAARRIARAEALRLRQLLSPEPSIDSDLARSMADAAVRFARQGVIVDVTCDVLIEPSMLVSIALMRATVAAISQLALEVDEPRCVVRVAADREVVEIRIRQHETAVAQSELRELLDRELAPIEGSATIRFVSGRGARIVMRVSE